MKAPKDWAFLRSQTGVYIYLLSIGLTVFLVGSFFASYYHLNVPANLIGVIRSFCPPGSYQVLSFALNWGGAILPVGMSVLLIFICLRLKPILIGVALTTLVVVFASYLLSEVRPLIGIHIRWGLIAVVSGTLTYLVMLLTMTRITLGVRALIPKVIAAGYVAGVLGTVIGADIFRNCALLETAKEAEIGAGGIVDAISLVGLGGAFIAGVLWVVPWYAAWWFAIRENHADQGIR